MNDASVGVPEWLRGMIRNHLGFARAGSNPAANAMIFFSSSTCWYVKCEAMNEMERFIQFSIYCCLCLANKHAYTYIHEPAV